MDGVFYWVVNMAIAGALSGLAVLAVRSIKRIPRRAACVLWLIPLIRALIPVSVAGRFSLTSLIVGLHGRTVPVSDIVVSAVNYIGAADGYFPVRFPDESIVYNVNGGVIEIKQSVWSRVFTVGFIVWAAVAAALMLTFAVIYFTTLRELKDARLLRDNVYVSGKIGSPAAYGIFRPRIVIPEVYREEDLKYILMHENAHIRHGDNLWRLLGFAVAALHWFDPLAWLFLKTALSDLELACDERVSKRLDKDGRKAYALALVGASRPKNVFVSAFGGAKLRTRVENILSYKKMTAVSAAGLAALIAAIAYLLLTNAA